MSLVLASSNPIPLIPELAEKVGVNEAIILQQVHYWCEQNKKNGNNQRNGHFWVYNSYDAWSDQFCWISKRSIKDIFKKLEDAGYLISANYNAQKYDRTKWYRVNYDALSKLLPISDFCTMHST